MVTLCAPVTHIEVFLGYFIFKKKAIHAQPYRDKATPKEIEIKEQTHQIE
jgi:hypothetical protein